MDLFDYSEIDKDMDKLYNFMNDNNLNKKRLYESNLNKLRNENHKKFYKINMVKLNNLPPDFKENVDKIYKIYKKLASRDLLNEEEKSAKESKKMLNEIYMNLTRLDKMIKTTVKQLERENDKKQSSFSIVDLKNIDLEEKIKAHVLNLYNELILFNSILEEDLYDNLKRQLKRKEYIDEIIKEINLGNNERVNVVKSEKISELSEKITQAVSSSTEKIQYLTDLIMEDSDYTDSFNDFLSFYNKIIDYDENDYDNLKQTYEILTDKEKLDTYIKKFENDFIDERERSLKDEKFIYEKVGIKNIKNSLNYISANYINIFNNYQKRVIKDCYDKLTKPNIDADLISKNLSYIVKYIWENSISNINAFDNNNFCILCSNSQFIEPKTEAILLTNNILNRMDSYLDYQIGFICSYDNNVLYITENEDIMSVDYDDLSSLKTPKQIEAEYINFDVINRIALNGYKTKIIGVYYIFDGDDIKYRVANKLANSNNLPLIIIKK